MGWKISRDRPQNELKLNLGTTIFGSFPEISYERIPTLISVLVPHWDLAWRMIYILLILKSSPMSVGSSVVVPSLQKYGAGFFIEANAAFFSTEINDVDYDYGSVSTDTKYSAGAGLGIAMGWKYLTRNNWVGELNFGVGRDFVNDGAYPRLGISIGKRF